jgi:hypothetical protein
MPDRLTRQGKRDLALLHLLGSVGLRRSEAAGLLLADVDEYRRAGDPRLRQAIGRSTSWWVTVRRAKRGRSRRVPLDHDTLEAISAWVKARPPAATEHLLLSLPRTGKPPGPLSTRDIARIVARHARPPGSPRTVAARTCSGTPSAPTSPTPAPTSAPSANSPATPTSAPPRSTPRSTTRACSRRSPTATAAASTPPQSDSAHPQSHLRCDRRVTSPAAPEAL